MQVAARSRSPTRISINAAASSSFQPASEVVEAKGAGAAAGGGGEGQEQGGAGLESADGVAKGATDARTLDARPLDARPLDAQKPDPPSGTVRSLASEVEGAAPSSAVRREERGG
jgi:hypothetical protein